MQKEVAVEVLKSFAAGLTSVSVKSRREKFREVTDVLKTNEFPEKIVEDLLKYAIPAFIFRYSSNPKLRNLTGRFLTDLSNPYPSATLSAYCHVVNKTFGQHKNSSLQFSKSLLPAWKWLILLTGKCWKDLDDKNFEVLSLALTNCAYLIFITADSTTYKIAAKKLKLLLEKDPSIVERLMKALTSENLSSPPNHNYKQICILSVLCKNLRDSKFFNEKSSTISIDRFLPTIIDFYVRSILSAKFKIDAQVLNLCGPIFNAVDSKLFSETLKPAIEKHMLRNSEYVLQAVGYLLSQLSIDLNEYAMELCKLLAVHLYSKDESVQHEACFAIRSLAERVNDANIALGLAKYMFKILTGSDVKLSNLAQKLGVLNGLGQLSYHKVNDQKSINELNDQICDLFIPFLKAEVNDTTLQSALKNLTTWTTKYRSSNFSKKFIDFVKEAVNFKSSVPIVKYSYMKLLNASFNSENANLAEPLLPVLLSTVEKAHKQPNQSNLVLESLPCSILILKLNTVSNLESTLKSFWNWVTDKKLYCNEKFIENLDEEGCLLLVELLQKLLYENAYKLTDANINQFYHLLILLLNNNRFFPVRKNCRILTKKLLSTVNAADICKSLIERYKEFLVSAENSRKNGGENSAAEHAAANYSQFSPKILRETLSTVSRVSDFEDQPENATKICVATLPLCCNPLLNSHGSQAWLDILKYYKIDPIDFLMKNLSDIIDKLIWVESKNEVAANCAQLLSSIGYEQFFVVSLKKCYENLPIDRLNDVTVHENLIFNAPDGVLFDKSVLDAGKEEVQTANIKRESKMYSYKEQMAAVAWQKEIEEKRRKEGKIKDELTPKQKEIAQHQIQKESEIRARIRLLYTPMQRALIILQHVMKGNHALTRKYMVDVQDHVMPLLKSPLAAEMVIEKCLLTLLDICFEAKDKCIAKSILYANLRLEKAACELDKNWCQEDQLQQAKRGLQSLYEKVFRRKTSINRSISSENDLQLTPSENGGKIPPTAEYGSALPEYVFAFVFPLIRLLFREQRKFLMQQSDDDGEQQFAVRSIDFCTTHVAWSNLSRRKNTEKLTIPFLSLTETLFKLIGTSTVGQLQQSTCKCALELADSLSRCAAELPDHVIVQCLNIILANFIQPAALVREYSLKCVNILSPWVNNYTKRKQGGGLTPVYVLKRLWIARFDVDENNQLLADKIWTANRYAPPMTLDFCQLLLDDVVDPNECVRESASEAIVKFVEFCQLRHNNNGNSQSRDSTNHVKPASKTTAASAAAPNFTDQLLDAVLGKLSNLYLDNLEMVLPVYDEFGRLLKEGGVDNWEARAGVALTLRKMCPLLQGGSDLQTYFDIILPDGINDRSGHVSHLMLLAAVEGVKIHGKQEISKLQPMLEKQLDEMPNQSKFDTLRHSIVVLLGTLAQHLNKDDPKVSAIVARLIEALSTPSQLVQEAVANCLPPLVPSIKEQVPALVEKLMRLLLDADQYGERRGAAFGLAGLVKGMGILSLRQLDIMTKLNEAITDKKVARHREGALLGLEMLCNMLGKLFEPYVVHVLPNLLLCFGDQDQHVRVAADECAKAVMRHLSVHGVKLVLPALLTALEEDSWRTKCGSVELLGAMAYCAPKQLSSCLPSIVPKLIEVLSDTHLRVQKAGSQALKHIGQVIKNPEIQAIVEVLLNALEDPAKKTASCLQVLLKTKFVHYIDAPSLALIMPVVHRALEDRSTETRRSAAQIVGSIYSLTDQKDVEPYLPQIMPGLKKCLLDPVPEVRSVAAKALGTMVGAAGEANFQELVPWLKQILTSPNSPVDRSGGAQGLAEVIGGLGLAELHRVMPDIVQTTERQDVEPHVRDGYILLYIYLPAVFGEKFLQYLPKVIPSILTALADENEYVRETALKAGQRIINMYCDSAIPLLLPSLQMGLFDDNWRIRYSSVQLLGDLLYKISGVSGKMSTESAEDDTFGTESLSKVVLDALGPETRNKVLSGLYICRSDVALMVRQAASHVWKVIVSNTPKTVKEILPTLFQLLLGCLASPNYDKQQVGARALGELVKKIGERILMDVVPVLEQGLKSDRADQRQGVCIALSEIMANTSKDTILMYANNLLPSVKMALSDPLPDVRSAAASTFSVLHSTMGPEAMNQVLTPLLGQLDDPDIGTYVLEGLQQVMALKSRVVLPYMVPKLTTPPVNTKALSHLAAVAGDSLNKHLQKIFTSLVSVLAQNLHDADQRKLEVENCAQVLNSVKDEQGAQIVLEILLQKTSLSSYDSEQTKIASAQLLAYFCENSKVTLNEFYGQIIRGCLNFYASDNDEVLKYANEALSAVVKAMDGKEQVERLPDFRQSVQALSLAASKHVTPSSDQSAATSVTVPGFCNQKSIQPVLIVFREGILNGSSENKEYASNGLSELLALSDPQALRPHVVNVTGPLIRVLGDRYPPNVKSAILVTLALLLEKVSVMLKPFLPQLQSTFQKTLSDPSSKLVRNKAANALCKLMSIHPKPDSVMAELCKNAKITEDASIRETYLTAIRLCMTSSIDKVTAETKALVESTASAFLAPDQEEYVRSASRSVLDFLAER